MSADKFLQLQKDVRHNQEDLKSFLRDLNSWETNIKKTDTDLKHDAGAGGSASTTKDKSIPPIRNKKLDTKKKRKKKKDVVKESDSIESTPVDKESSSEESQKKIRAYDYRSWDTFDVDAACAALDSDDEEGTRKREAQEEEEEEETDSEAEREEMEVQRKIMEANAEKEKGNNLFKKGKYEDAVACYSKGLQVDPDNALLSANRAMALLKLKRYEEAEQDCDSAISLDSTYIKAYARRGTARLELGKLEEAKKDFQQVLNIETENKQAKNEIKKIDKLLKEREEERRRAEEPSNIVNAVDKPPHLRSKRPLKRMVIQEVGVGVAEEKQREREKLRKQKEMTERTSLDHNNQSAEVDRTNGNKIQEIKSRTEESKPGRTEHNNNSQASVSPRGKGNSPRGGGGKSPAVLSNKPTVPGVPSTSYQLQGDWKRLQSHSDVLFEYYKKIPPASYPKLFQNSLDSSMLNQILHLLTVSYIPSNTPIFETLERLSAVKRFDMNIMFMSSKEKQGIKDLFSHLKSEEVDEQRCQQLAKKYGL